MACAASHTPQRKRERENQELAVSLKTFKAKSKNEEVFFFVLRKKGGKTKKRMKDEETGKGECVNTKSFLRFCRT